MKTRAGFDAVNAARDLDRFTFIAKFLVRMTARKADRELVGGLQVREVKGGYVCGYLDIAKGSTLDARAVYEEARRSSLCYYVQQAEHLRIAAHAG